MLSNTALLFQIQSCCILFLLFLGSYLHKKRKLHIKIMSTAMIWDVLLILQIELGRNAIDKASKALTNPMILNIHVSLATLTVLFYIAMVWSGRRVLREYRANINMHKRLGYMTLLLRTLTLITSFYAVIKNP